MRLRIGGTSGLAARFGMLAAALFVGLLCVGYATAAPVYGSGGHISRGTGYPPAVGETVGAVAGTWTYSGTVTFAYTWQRGDVTVGTGQTYTAQDADVGSAITLAVSATDDTGAASASVDSVGPVTWPPPVNNVPPSIKGDLKPGGTLTADVGGWSLPNPAQPGPIHFMVSWYSYQMWVPLPGDNHAMSVTLPDDSAGWTVDLEVTAYAPSGCGYDKVGHAGAGAVVGTASPPPGPVMVSSTTNIAAGQVLKGTVHWTVQASGKAHAVKFYNNNLLLKEVVADGDSWAIDLDTTRFADGVNQLGYDIYNAADQRVYDGPSIPVTIRNTSSILYPAPVNKRAPRIVGDPVVGNTVVADPGDWTLVGAAVGQPITYTYLLYFCHTNSSPPPGEDPGECSPFSVDGHEVPPNVDHWAIPDQMYSTSRTTKETLALQVTASIPDGAGGTSSNVVWTAREEAILPRVVQNITAGQTLQGTVTWRATPSGPLQQVVFALDGNKTTFTDTTAPYEYLLDTTKLSNGAHVLGLTVTLKDGSVVWQPYQIGTVTITNPAGGNGGGSGGGSAPNTPARPAAGSLLPAAPPALPAPKPQPNRPLRLVSGGFALTAKTATAGKPFGAAIFVIRSDTGKRISGATIKAKATIAGKPLALAWKGWYRGAAGATWRIPTSAKGKTLVGSLTISYHGTTLTKNFTAKVR